MWGQGVWMEGQTCRPAPASPHYPRHPTHGRHVPGPAAWILCVDASVTPTHPFPQASSAWESRAWACRVSACAAMPPPGSAARR